MPDGVMVGEQTPQSGAGRAESPIGLRARTARQGQRIHPEGKRGQTIGGVTDLGLLRLVLEVVYEVGVIEFQRLPVGRGRLAPCSLNVLRAYLPGPSACE